MITLLSSIFIKISLLCMKNTILYNDMSTLSTAKREKLTYPFIARINNETKKGVAVKTFKNYFWVQQPSNSNPKNVIKITPKNGSSFQYSINGIIWFDDVNELSLYKGCKIYVKGNNKVTQSDTEYGIAKINSYNGYGTILGGNIMSLMFGDEDFDAITDISDYPYAFYDLFNGFDTITDASQLILPATKLAPYCYANMFKDSYNITHAPELPATELAEYCYRYMFDMSKYSMLSNGFTPPALPATKLAPYCYQGMFRSCYALNYTPDLPATELEEGCYSNMFNGLQGGTAAKMYIEKFAKNSCANMYWCAYGLKELTNFTMAPGAITAQYCCDNMFYNCQYSGEVSPILATSLVAYSFRYCYDSNTITHIDILSTSLSNYCLFNFGNIKSMRKHPSVTYSNLRRVLDNSSTFTIANISCNVSNVGDIIECTSLELFSNEIECIATSVKVVYKGLCKVLYEGVTYNDVEYYGQVPLDDIVITPNETPEIKTYPVTFTWNGITATHNIIQRSNIVSFDVKECQNTSNIIGTFNTTYNITWENFVNSSNNDGRFSIVDNNVMYTYTNLDTPVTYNLRTSSSSTSTSNYVKSTSTITRNKAFYVQQHIV